MSNTIKFVVVMALFLLGCLTFNLGMDYINFGYGLTPYIALPISLLCIVIIYKLTVPEDDEDINS